jgi:hypothetical protein
MKATDFAKLGRELVASRKECDALKVKLAGLEKRAAAEVFLTSLLQDPTAPMHLRPSGVEDFLSKRDQVEKLDLETAKLAAQMASRGGFEIGEPEDASPRYSSSSSKADDQFVDWLSGFGQ